MVEGGKSGNYLQERYDAEHMGDNLIKLSSALVFTVNSLFFSKYAKRDANITPVIKRTYQKVFGWWCERIIVQPCL